MITHLISHSDRLSRAYVRLDSALVLWAWLRSHMGLWGQR